MKSDPMKMQDGVVPSPSPTYQSRPNRIGAYTHHSPGDFFHQSLVVDVDFLIGVSCSTLSWLPCFCDARKRQAVRIYLSITKT